MNNEMKDLRKYLTNDINDLLEDISNTKRIIYVSLLLDCYFIITMLLTFAVGAYMFGNIFYNKNYIEIIVIINLIIVLKFFYSINQKDNKYLHVDRYRQRKYIKALKIKIQRNKEVILRIDFGEDIPREEYIWIYNKDIII